MDIDTFLENLVTTLKSAEEIENSFDFDGFVDTASELAEGHTFRKEVSLDARSNDIRQAFYNTLPQPEPEEPREPEAWENAWVLEVYEDHLIVEDMGEAYSVSFEENEEGEFSFGEPVEVEMMWQPKSLHLTVKSIDENSMVLGGYGVVWGGKDLEGDFFTKNTDFWFDRITETPMVLYDHGQNDEIKKVPVGNVIGKKSDDVGLWVESQIERSNQYFEGIRQLVEEGRLGYSSGAVPHLVERKSNGELTSWAVVEFSLTPTPAEPRVLSIEQIRSLAESEPAYKALLPDNPSQDVQTSDEDREAERERKLREATLGEQMVNLELMEE